MAPDELSGATLMWLATESAVRVNGEDCAPETVERWGFKFEAVTVERALGGAMADMNRAVGRLVKTVYRAGWRSRDESTRKQIADRLEKVREEIDTLVA